MALTRLRTDELANVWLDAPDAPMQIALLAVFDAGPFRRADGSLDTARICDELATRARHVAPLTRRIAWTRIGEGRPVWVADPSFAPAAHVQAVTPPLDADLPSWAANRLVRPLDRDRPLWRAEVVDGLPDGRFAVLLVVSHVLADGRAGVAIAGSLLDARPDGTPPPVPEVAVPPLPSHRELVREHLHEIGSALRRVRFPGSRDRARRRQGLRQLRSVLADLRIPAPATSLRRRLGPDRRLAIVRLPLEDVQRTGSAWGVTVNDLLLAAVAGGLRDLLLTRGECVPGLFVRATVPAATGASRRQVMGMLVVDLPVGEPDPSRRLALIRRTTAADKIRLRAVEGDVTDLPLPTPLVRAMVRGGRRFGSRSISLSVTDVAGPPRPLWLSGARLLEAVPIAPLTPLVPLAVAALSYAGELAISVHADGAVADLDVLASGLARSFRSLREQAPTGR